ncbi:MAG: nuclear transport factor 2 family protein [Acetobacteraceae bacterium]|nr:nuclear transport factor 2 family protein [Acetobacteraceae bacterium]
MTGSERNHVSNDDFVLTWTEARHLVQAVEDVFGAADLVAIEAGFTEDAVARFADFPEMRGRAEIMRFLTARFTRTRGYKLTKTLHVLTGNRLANTWDASWTDAQTGKSMVGRGTEIWTLRGRRIAVWDATFNVWEKGGPPATPVV